MNTAHARTVLSLSAIGLLITCGVLYAGPLNPPAGPVTSTYKTLTEVEPRIIINAANTPGDANSLFKITQPGSYHLISNITGVTAKHGIEIAASGVTIDLMGFDLNGVPGSLDGVSNSISSLTNITVRNGSVRAWGDKGIDLANGTFNCILTDVLASNNSGDGIALNSGFTITRCSAFQNGGRGIFIGFGSVASDCTAYFNSGHGIAAGDGCTIIGCSSYRSGANGFHVGYGCTITSCTSRESIGDGIYVTGNCLVLSNTCDQNGVSIGDGAGIHALFGDNRIEGNNCTLADRGIDVDAAGSIIIKNTCSGNTLDWSIAANNVVGPILDRRAPASAAISGFSFAGSLGSTDANANFSY